MDANLRDILNVQKQVQKRQQPLKKAGGIFNLFTNSLLKVLRPKK